MQDDDHSKFFDFLSEPLPFIKKMTQSENTDQYSVQKPMENQQHVEDSVENKIKSEYSYRNLSAFSTKSSNYLTIVKPVAIGKIETHNTMENSKETIIKVLIYGYLHGINTILRHKYSQIINDISKQIMVDYKTTTKNNLTNDLIFDIIKNYLGPYDYITMDMYGLIIDKLIRCKFIKKTLGKK